MPDRLIEILVTSDDATQVRALLDEKEPNWIWQQSMADTTQFKVSLPVESVEVVLDALQPTLEQSGGRALVIALEASLPRASGEAAAQIPRAGEEQAAPKVIGQISRHELYEDLVEFTRATPAFYVTTVLAVIVAAIGLTRDSPAITIGAMVIAPLLGPNMALALATTLADKSLGLRALKTNVAGVSTAIAVAVIAGLVSDVDKNVTEIASRTSISPGEILLALATGVAGAIAVTRGVATSLVGVMVAVALLPPLVIAAMLLVQGQYGEAANAALLLATNVICVNLAGVATFYVQGIRPSTWWEAKRSKRATKVAIGIWVGLLALIAVLIALSQQYIEL